MFKIKKNNKWLKSFFSPDETSFVETVIEGAEKVTLHGNVLVMKNKNLIFIWQIFTNMKCNKGQKKSTFFVSGKTTIAKGGDQKSLLSSCLFMFEQK